MSNRVTLSKDGKTIEFSQPEAMPTTVKKFRRSPDIDGFYRFVYENGLQKETLQILTQISKKRKAAKKAAKKKK